jgi:diguanylate cyclase (GGDEF)-like protein
MNWRRRALSPRALVGLVLGLWVILVMFATARAIADGTVWAFQLSAAAQGTTVATAVDPLGYAGAAGMRTGDLVLSVDGHDPGNLVDTDIPSTVQEVVFRDDSNDTLTIASSPIPMSLFVLLSAGGLLFALLGGLVYRWSADVALGRLFLLLSCSFATALLTAPASLLGNAFPGYLSGPAAVIAASALFGVFVYFPRPLRHASRLTGVSVTVAMGLAVAQALEPILPNAFVAPIEVPTWFWIGFNLVGAVLVLSVRTARRRDRRALGPLLVGTAFGVGPILLLNLMPRIFGLSPWLSSDLAAIAIAAIPISFAYSILRAQVFGLDVLMRRVLLRATVVAVGVVLFAAGWAALRAVGLASEEAALAAAALTGLAVPTVAGWLMRWLDAWLYQPLHELRLRTELVSGDGLERLGSSLSVRLRQLLPVQWAAVVVDNDTPVNIGASRFVGADGRVPSWLDPRSAFEQSRDQANVVQIHRFDTGVVRLLAGPRLDGEPLDGIETEAMRMLANSLAATFDAALLRERAEDEARFRQGLTDLARDLASAATVNDVLRSVNSHAAELLGADAAGLWRSSIDGGIAVLEDAAPATIPTVVLRQVFEARERHATEREWTTIVTDGTAFAFALDDGGAEPVVCLVRRAPNVQPFGPLEEHRGRELINHTRGALRRAAQREVLEEQLRHRAFYDPLTGLPNRALFLDRIGHAVARGKRAGQELAVLFVDLDRFKVVNDSLGHAAGDQLLVQVARRLRACLRDSDTVARLGGDEFTVLLEGPNAVADAVLAAQRILATLRAPIPLDGQDTYAAASIGIAGGVDILESGRDLLREADIALYRAKGAGRGRYTVFEDRMSHLPAEHLHLESELHRAIERNELRVHYQPIFSLSDGRITGFEALVRWEHPTKGLIQPGDFIPLAEDSGLIVPIGRWVLQESCRQMRQWQLEYPNAEQMSVSVNLSGRQFQDPELMEDIEAAVHSSGIDPRLLQLEITESVVMQEPEATVFKLRALKALGINLAVDDFGTGYSSLAYLKRFPIDVLKIDRAFVGGLADGEHDVAIVQTVVSLAKALGLRTTAEGIEEQAQWELLEEFGCDQGQGYFYSRPLRADAIPVLLEKQSNSRFGAAAAAA